MTEHIVNRVTTLHRPLPEGATFAEVVAYWQKRIPGVDMYAIADKAITETWQQIGEAIGLDMQAIDEGLQTITDILADEAQHEYNDADLAQSVPGTNAAHPQETRQ
ncbi:hypothetical protein PP506_gp68 [Gordonia phage DobbysSock]|uniref:Uncharacterized protein n=1 Tax=Gordonia phage DobbysSock TaxID=2652880 RepID=A0A5P8DCS5_9CAUD|nr:hypothetical protein [Gordonia sp. GONU]YP_010654390.1 hypothetical protein PP506_gp68 [Gordonia phage DobbysSock]MCR8897285.1 hypothetical protein [Gordonia sp. GONU]QFP96189.1 hypothetical protein DOBBYSSOCK_SEA_68 [Gordonia phage DobbysSock]